jgi:cellobiose phosphorylase
MTIEKSDLGWTFYDQEGSFTLNDPHKSNYLYFPLVNEAGMMSVITPILHGDIKVDQNAFLTAPVSVEDLHNTRSARNFWVYVDGVGPWSATGNSAKQVARMFDNESFEQVSLEAGFLWHKIVRQNHKLGLRAEIVNFVPTSDDRVELMKITLTNISEETLRITPTAAVPIYGRSADNLRDHRHVTSLLHRIQCHLNGVLVRPTLTFDERGHKPNQLTYLVLGAESDGTTPEEFIPIVEEFIGEGGTLDWPLAVVDPSRQGYSAGQSFEGYEAIGGLRFQKAVLKPGASQSYLLMLAVTGEVEDADDIVKNYGEKKRFDHWFEETGAYWREKVKSLTFRTADPHFNLWMRWVGLQPILRRLYGNSFLPYHDYGRGGRGWRDLWQDILALMLMETGDVSEMLFHNFAGIRIDGSNATIIGHKPGEFKADRNDIPRVWMDHGTWPFLTTFLYIHLTGDLAFLLREQTYFKDHLVFRSQAIDETWLPAHGMELKTTSGNVYHGTILEHLLVQHLTSFFNVGERNNIKLEGADWNDGMDMASEQGESVAFTALYASNLRQLSELLLKLEALGIYQVQIAAEMTPLLDTLNDPVDYALPKAKQNRLVEYFERCQSTISGEKRSIAVQDIAQDLATKADWLIDHIRKNEWISNKQGYAWFNGYYDNDGQRLEGDNDKGVRMTLTGQVFTLMGGVATNEQAQQIVQAADRYLFDPAVGGYRLNSDFGEVLLNMGRCFGFAFGHKENGAMFSHMAVMFANALYQRDLVEEGHKVLNGIYQHSQDFPTSQMYPGIPEYISPRGRGMYPYLTGSASWYLLTMLTEVFGVKGDLGDLAISPKLLQTQFDAAGDAEVNFPFAGRKFNLIYHNPTGLNYDDYKISGIKLDGAPTPFHKKAGTAIVPRDVILGLDTDQIHVIEVGLS